MDYYYDNQTLPTTKPPNFTPTFSTGRLIATCYGGVSSGAGSYQSYDQLGRVISSYQQTGSQNYGFGYGYNLASEMTAETYPSGRQVITEYDSAGRAVGIRAAAIYYAGGAASDATNRIQYAPQGAVSTMKLGNGKWEHTNFNNRLQPTQIGLGTSGTDSSLLKLDYEYTSSCQTGNNGNVLKQTINSAGLILTQNYCYDALNHLSSASENSGASWSQTYGYDRYGNRWVSASPGFILSGLTPTSPGQFNTANNRLFASGYDNAGNQTGDALSRSFTYDAENRQLTFNATAGQYSYDGDGHRVKKVVGSVTTVFVYNAMGQLTAEYTNTSDATPPVGGGGTSYLTSDHLGSTRVVTGTNPTQPVKARYDYLPFGEELGAGIGGRTTGMGYGGADSTKQKFTQKERDNESGLDYFGARYYSGPQGRFTSPDPNECNLTRQTSGEDGERVFRGDLSQPQHWNRYPYVLNNPLRLVDPDGRKWTESVQLGNAMLNVFGPPGSVLDLGDFFGHSRGVNFFYKDPNIEWAKISTAGGTPENGGCTLGCFETYEAFPVALSLNLRFDIDEKTGNLTGVAVDLGRQDVISSGRNPLRTVWSPLPGLGHPAAEVTNVQINTGVLRGLTNQQLQAVGNAFRRPQQGPLGPIATAISQADSDEQKRRQEEERKRQEKEKKKKH